MKSLNYGGYTEPPSRYVHDFECVEENDPWDEDYPEDHCLLFPESKVIQDLCREKLKGWEEDW